MLVVRPLALFSKYLYIHSESSKMESSKLLRSQRSSDNRKKGRRKKKPQIKKRSRHAHIAEAESSKIQFEKMDRSEIPSNTQSTRNLKKITALTRMQNVIIDMQSSSIRSERKRKETFFNFFSATHEKTSLTKIRKKIRPLLTTYCTNT